MSPRPAPSCNGSSRAAAAAEPRLSGRGAIPTQHRAAKQPPPSSSHLWSGPSCQTGGAAAMAVGSQSSCSRHPGSEQGTRPRAPQSPEGSG